MSGPRIGLALSGGAARGAAHIGVIEVLKERRIDISAVVGTSSGSIVGSFLAAGRTVDEMKDEAAQVTWRRLVDFVFPRRGLVTAGGLEELVERMVEGAEFKDLKVPFAAVACDLNTGEEVILDEGSVARSVIASCAIPGVFVPVEIDGRILVDGGVVNNVPASVLKEKYDCDFVIAVDVCTPAAFPDRTPGTIVEVLTRSLEIMQARNGLIGCRYADLVIRPDLREYDFMDLNRSQELIRLGREAAVKALEEASCFDIF